MIQYYKCKCGYKGELEWVKKREKRDGGIWESEGLGCPDCKRLLSSGKINEINERDNDMDKIIQLDIKYQHLVDLLDFIDNYFESPIYIEKEQEKALKKLEDKLNKKFKKEKDIT